MNIIDILIQLVNYLFQHLLLPILPVEIPIYPLTALQAQLVDVQATIIVAFGGLGKFLPVGAIFIFISTIIIAELNLFVWRLMKYGIEIFAKK